MAQPYKNYNFICGVFRSRERRFLSPAALNALIDSRDVPDALVHMPEGAFRSAVQAAPDAPGIDTGFRREREDLRVILASYSPDADFARAVLWPWDFHNLSVAVLQKLRGKDDRRLFGPEGELAIAPLAAMANEMKFDLLPEPFAGALRKAFVAYYDQGKNPQCFAMALDRRKQIAVSDALGRLSAGLARFCAESADAAIGQVIGRARRAGIPWTVVRWAVDGHPDAGAIRDLYAMAPEEWPTRIAGVTRPRLRESIIASAQPRDKAARSAPSDAMTAKAVQDWLYRPPSAEYAYAYVTRFLSDLSTIRLVLLAKVGGVTADEIRARIPHAAV